MDMILLNMNKALRGVIVIENSLFVHLDTDLNLIFTLLPVL